MPVETKLGQAYFTIFKLSVVKRRTDERYFVKLSAPGELVFTDPPLELVCWVHDISTRGVGFTSCDDVPMGKRLLVHLRIAETGQRLSVPGHIVHTTAIDEDTWRIGCLFDQRISDGTLESLFGH